MWFDLNEVAESLLLGLQAITFSETKQNLTQNDSMVRMPLNRSNILLWKGTSFIKVNARKAANCYILIWQRQKWLCKNTCLVNPWLHLRNEWCSLVLIIQMEFYYQFQWLKEQVVFEKLEWLSSSQNDCTSDNPLNHSHEERRCFSSSGHSKSDFSYPIPT